MAPAKKSYAELVNFGGAKVRPSFLVPLESDLVAWATE